MVKNSFISIILKEQEENKENGGYVEFQVVSFTNKIRRLHIWNCTKKTIYLKEVCGKFWENVNGCWLICQKKIERVIKN